MGGDRWAERSGREEGPPQTACWRAHSGAGRSGGACWRRAPASREASAGRPRWRASGRAVSGLPGALGPPCAHGGGGPCGAMSEPCPGSTFGSCRFFSCVLSVSLLSVVSLVSVRSKVSSACL